MPAPSKPVLMINPPPSGGGTYTFYDRLLTHPGLTHAYPMRSLAQIDPKQTPGMSAQKVGPDRLPWGYDATEDSAYLQVHPEAGFREPQTRRVKTGDPSDRRSLLFVFDFKYDAGWYWHGDGYMQNYKNWYLYCDEKYWMQASHMHLHVGAHQDPPGVEETIGWLWLGIPGERWKNGESKIAGEPLSYRVGERLEPAKTRFFVKVNRWTRHYFYIEGEAGDGAKAAPINLSTWYADQDRDPIVVYDRIPLTLLSPLTLWSFSYDTSAEGERLNPLATKWIRNVAVLRGLSLADVRGLLERPIA